jgi:hypothetical protein
MWHGAKDSVRPRKAIKKEIRLSCPRGIVASEKKKKRAALKYIVLLLQSPLPCQCGDAENISDCGREKIVW